MATPSSISVCKKLREVGVRGGGCDNGLIQVEMGIQPYMGKTG